MLQGFELSNSWPGGRVQRGVNIASVVIKHLYYYYSHEGVGEFYFTDSILGYIQYL